MCGIAGAVGGAHGGELLRSVERASSALEHRGPDASGILSYERTEGRWQRATFSDSADASAVLAVRRLAILDLSERGHQPMECEAALATIAYNGELYNYVELRRELEAKGHRFRSSSDTEVVLRSYVEWGPRCPERFIGMFAFAILDREREELFLARDPFGMKPLYFAEKGSDFVFASEISALLEGFPWITRRIDPEGMREYLARGATDRPGSTLFADVRSLPAASTLRVSLHDVSSRTAATYWSPPPAKERLSISFEQAATELRELFLRNVEWHLRSDVPVGSLLSGGLDSSSVVMAMRHVGGAALDIHTFSYVGTGGAVSEKRWIDLVNGEAGAVAHEVSPSPEELQTDLDAFVEALDEPIATVAVYVQNKLFEAARVHSIPVILDGQGGDELMGGYADMRASRLAELLASGRLVRARRLLRGVRSRSAPWDPRPRRVALSGLARATPLSAALRRRRRLLRPSWVRPAWWNSIGPDPAPDPLPVGRHALAMHLRWSVARGTLPTLLRFEDRNSMAHSVECRLPFLTTGLADFVLRLPSEYLIADDGTTKAVFRKAMEGIVPEAILSRRYKIGFSVPNDEWLMSVAALRDAARRAARYPPLQPEPCLELIREATESGRPMSGEQAFATWRLAGLGLWAERFGAEW